MTRALEPLAILGGTFDPIHYGHLRLAADVEAALSLPEVRLIPAGMPPHRPPPAASPEDRFAMTALGCAEFAGLSADRLEIDRAGPSYTVATLEALRAREPGRPLALIVGADAFAGLAQWWHWERLFSLAHLLVVERPGTAPVEEALTGAVRAQWDRHLSGDASRLERALAGSILRVSVTPQPISASAIRAELARGRAGFERVRGLLPATVLDYIDRNRLYRSSPDAS
ncbi:MAG TPA: nicotinate-nucleotide adenylyltransferase [Casimicrobiaceae bacterium]|nr:nicotinate-nucleotide adenylyltransferase [Casimicrobiaceae bacterium]